MGAFSRTVLTAAFLASLAGGAWAQSAPQQGAQPLPPCRWGTLGNERVRLCPEYDRTGSRVWRIVERRPAGYPQQAGQGGWYDPAYARDLPPAPAARPQRAEERSSAGWRPRVRPRVGVGVNSSGDVGVGAGVGIGLGILDLGVGFYD